MGASGGGEGPHRRRVPDGTTRRFPPKGEGLYPLRQVRELVGALAPALVETHPLVLLAAGDGEVADAGGVAGLAVPRSSKVRITVMNGLGDGSQAAT